MFMPRSGAAWQANIRCRALQNCLCTDIAVSHFYHVAYIKRMDTGLAPVLHAPQVEQRPSLGLLAREAAIAITQRRRVRALPIPAIALAAVPRPIVVIPGFLADDSSCARLTASLNGAGHNAVGWGQGRNLGVSDTLFEDLGARLDELCFDHPVTLVGWSLGGLMAREFAKFAPARVSTVVTMGSPFSGHPARNNHAWHLYRLIAGQSGPDPRFDLAAKPPVETIALWSSSDGIVSASSASGRFDERDRAVEIDCGHLAMVWDDRAIRTVVTLLHD